MIKIILDTNFLVYCAENKVDYATEIGGIINEGYELVVPQQVIDELRELSEKAKKFSDRTAAFLALKILKANNVIVISARGRYADDAILEMVRMGNIVATLDLELRNKLHNYRKIVIQGVKKIAFE